MSLWSPETVVPPRPTRSSWRATVAHPFSIAVLASVPYCLFLFVMTFTVQLDPLHVYTWPPLMKVPDYYGPAFINDLDGLLFGVVMVAAMFIVPALLALTRPAAERLPVSDRRRPLVYRMLRASGYVLGCYVLVRPLSLVHGNFLHGTFLFFLPVAAAIAFVRRAPPLRSPPPRENQ
jgi:hypothetical protein